jgi:hypothetical protein
MALAWWRPPVDVEALAQLVGDSSTSLLPCAHQRVACRVSLSLVASPPAFQAILDRTRSAMNVNRRVRQP